MEFTWGRGGRVRESTITGVRGSELLGPVAFCTRSPPPITSAAGCGTHVSHSRRHGITRSHSGSAATALHMGAQELLPARHPAHTSGSLGIQRTGSWHESPPKGGWRRGSRAGAGYQQVKMADQGGAVLTRPDPAPAAQSLRGLVNQVQALPKSLRPGPRGLQPGARSPKEAQGHQRAADSPPPGQRRAVAAKHRPCAVTEAAVGSENGPGEEEEREAIFSDLSANIPGRDCSPPSQCIQDFALPPTCAWGPHYPHPHPSGHLEIRVDPTTQRWG